MIAPLNIKQIIQNRFEQKRRHFVYLRAFTNTYSIFAQQHPAWAASLFDEHFLSHHFLPSVDGSAQNTDLPKPITLARAWVEQCLGFNPAKKQELIAELTPVASDFLRLFTAELHNVETAANRPNPVIAGI